MRYYGYTTDFDVMKEELIQGAELTDYWNFPILEPYHGSAENTVSFRKSFEKSFSDCDHTNLNFFEDDHYFNSLWNSPFRYLEHLRKFQSVCMPDFSKSEETPLPINIWNNYRNRALAFWMQENGIDVVPTMSVMPESCWGWCWDGMPKGSTYCCCTNGMVKDKVKRDNFIKSFHEAERRLRLERVIIVGGKIDELNPACEVVYLDSRSAQNTKRKSRSSMHDKNPKVFIHNA